MDDDRQPGDAGDAAGQFQDAAIDFVRAFGLLRSDTTPCGQPMSVSEAHALRELARDGEVGQGDLAARLRLEKSSVSRLVAGLERRGWVERRPDAADGRAWRIRLTDAGAVVESRLARARAARYEEILGRIPAGERPGVVAALRLLANAARGDARDGDG